MWLTRRCSWRHRQPSCNYYRKTSFRYRTTHRHFYRQSFPVLISKIQVSLVNSLHMSNFCRLQIQGTKIFKYCTCSSGRVTYNFHSFCKHMHLSFKSVCNKEHKGVICYMTSSSYSFQSTCPTGRVLWEELLVLSRFHS